MERGPAHRNQPGVHPLRRGWGPGLHQRVLASVVRLGRGRRGRGRPLRRPLPRRRHLPVISIGACLALAVLDTAGTYAAVTAARGSRIGWVLGVAAFAVLFAVLVAAVDTASLTGVMLGWIVLVQLGAIAIDVRVLGTHLNPGARPARATATPAHTPGLRWVPRTRTSMAMAPSWTRTIHPSITPVREAVSTAATRTANRTANAATPRTQPMRDPRAAVTAA